MRRKRAVFYAYFFAKIRKYFDIEKCAGTKFFYKEESSMEESNKFLGTEKISKLLLKFAIPCILSLLISSLYNIVDQIFIGNSELGYLGNAATTIVYPVTIIAVAFAWCFGDGAAAFLSLCQGRKDTKDVHKAIGDGIIITFVISIIFLILGFAFMDNIL